MHWSVVEKPDVNRLVPDPSGVNDIFAVAIARLEGTMDDYQERGIEFLFPGMKGPARDLVARAGWNEKYDDRITPTSVKHAWKRSGR